MWDESSLGRALGGVEELGASGGGSRRGHLPSQPWASWLSKSPSRASVFLSWEVKKCLYVIRLGQRFAPVNTPGNRTGLEACLGTKLSCGLGRWPENLAKRQFNQSGPSSISSLIHRVCSSIYSRDSPRWLFAGYWERHL